MNKTINLLIPEKNDLVLLKRIQLLRLLSLSMLFIVIVSVVSVFFLILVSPLPSLRQQENAALEKLATLRTKSSRLFLVRERLAKIDKILAQRPTFEKSFARIEQEMPGGVVIDRIRTTETTFAITFSSSSLATITQFIANIQNMKAEDKLFNSLLLSQLSYSQDLQKYTVTVNSGGKDGQ